jgi:hypothetical protein
VLRSHVNYMVGDTKSWAQQAAQFFDTHPAVGPQARDCLDRLMDAAWR